MLCQRGEEKEILKEDSPNNLSSLYLSMLILAQFPLFDLRILQDRKNLVPSVKGSSFSNEGTSFLNNFGSVVESNGRPFSEYVLSEDRRFIECKNSLKFESLKDKSNQYQIKPNFRRMYLNENGGARIAMEFFLKPGSGKSPQKIEKVLQNLLSNKIRLKSPRKKTLSVPLAKLTPSFKNLYLSSSSIGDSYLGQEKLIRSESVSVFINLEEKDLPSLKRLKGFESFSYDPNLGFHYKSQELSGERIDIFILSGNSDQKDRHRYQIMKIHRAKQNLESLLYFKRTGISIPEIFENTYQNLLQKLSDHEKDGSWHPILNIHRQFLRDEWGDLLNVESDSITLFREEIRNLVAQNQLKTALIKLQNKAKKYSEERYSDATILLSRYNKNGQDKLRKVISDEVYNIEYNQISVGALELLSRL